MEFTCLKHLFMLKFIKILHHNERMMVSKREEPVIDKFSSVLCQIFHSSPVEFLVARLMYHKKVVWYRKGLLEILAKFSIILTLGCPTNLHFLPSFPTPEFE